MAPNINTEKEIEMIALSILILHDGNKNVTKEDVKKILKAAKLNENSKYIDMFVEQFKSCPDALQNLIKSYDVGTITLDAAPVTTSNSSTAVQEAAKKQPEPQSESDDDMGLDLFG